MAHSLNEGSPDVIIVGGGIVGSLLAYDLAGLGVSVTLLERQEIAKEASWASAGIVSPPVESMGTRAEMARLAYERYPALVADVESATGIDTGFTVTGEVMAVLAEAVPFYREMQQWQTDRGIESVWLEGDALREHEPALHERFVAGLFTPKSASVRLDRLTTALAGAAVQRGATVHENLPVTEIITEDGRAAGVQTPEGTIRGGAVVVTAGAWSGGLLETLDILIPTHPVHGQMLAIADPPVPIRSVIAGGGGYIVPRADGTVAVGATELPEVGYDKRPTPAGLAWLIDLIDSVVPSLNGGTFLTTWAGLRPGSGDGELIVGPLPHIPNVWVAAGHFRSGALLAPGTSRWLADSIVAGTAVDELRPFSPARFL